MGLFIAVMNSEGLRSVSLRMVGLLFNELRVLLLLSVSTLDLEEVGTAGIIVRVIVSIITGGRVVPLEAEGDVLGYIIR